jgi:hypothetical protein
VRTGRISRDTNGLIQRIRALVAEQRRLEGAGNRGRAEANRREIARLQRQLGSMVKRELTAR